MSFGNVYRQAIRTVPLLRAAVLMPDQLRAAHQFAILFYEQCFEDRDQWQWIGLGSCAQQAPGVCGKQFSRSCEPQWYLSSIFELKDELCVVIQNETRAVLGYDCLNRFARSFQVTNGVC